MPGGKKIVSSPERQNTVSVYFLLLAKMPISVKENPFCACQQKKTNRISIFTLPNKLTLETFSRLQQWIVYDNYILKLTKKNGRVP